MEPRCPTHYLVISKSKWEQLVNQAHPSKLRQEAIQKCDKLEYYKALDAKSKELQKNWPDTLEGCIAKVEARKERQRARDMAFIKSFENKERKRITANRNAIAKARQEIFNRSCYGVQLLSALRESRDMEEREVQIEFKKFMKQKDEEYNKYVDEEIASMSNNMFDYAKKQDEAQAKRKLTTETTTKYNKEVHERKLKQEADEKEQERLGELEDARLQKMLLELESHAMDHCKEKAIEEAKVYAAESRAFKQAQQIRDREDDALIEAYQKYRDRVACKVKQTWDKIIKSQGDESECYKKCCELVKLLTEMEQKEYDDFVQKGIEEHQAKKNIEDNKQKLKQINLDKNHFNTIVEDYKQALDKKGILKHCNKCVCERQTWVSKPRERIIKEVKGSYKGDTYKPETFRKPCTKFSDKLKKRENEPTPWTGLGGQHQQFAEEASKIIQECKYKHMANKVVDEYRKNAGLDSTTLPVSQGKECKCRRRITFPFV